MPHRITHRLCAAVAAGAVAFVPLTADATEPAARHDGPHAAAVRKPAQLTTTHRQGVVVRDFDLGNADLGSKRRPGTFRSPVRGVLVTPDKPDAAAPLVVVSHLRTFGCSDNTFAYPCAKKATEIRADRGMTYLGEALAAHGYAVLIPDLSPLWIGEEDDKPYDQNAGWLTVVGKMRDAVVAASAGKKSALGEGLKNSVDGSHTALVTHSRSAAIANVAVRAWAGSSTPITSLASYGGFYHVAQDDKDTFAPPPPADIPFLGVDGSADHDVKLAGATWLPEHVGQTRTAPALGLLLPGFGHNYVNRALSERQVDDRTGTTPSSPTAADHEKMLTGTISAWLEQTVRHRSGPFPLLATDPLPGTVLGLPARWLALSHGAAARWAAGPQAKPTPVGKGGAATTCRTFMPMDPTPYPDRCVDPDLGTMEVRSYVARTSLTETGGAGVPLRQERPRQIALHLAPAGDRADKATETPLRVTVTLQDGAQVAVPVPAGQAALRNLATADENGSYTVATLRLALPEQVRKGVVTAVALTGGTGSGTIDLRGIDLLR